MRLSGVSSRAAWCIAVGIGLAGGGRAPALEVPRGTEVIHVDLAPGKFGTVHFRHARHNDEFKRPDGSRVRCRDCHHRLSAEEPASAQEDMKCGGCHAKYGEPAKTIAGEVAPVLASLRPDGAIEYRSILFHEWCWACHRKTMRDGHQNDRCKLCHERGVSDDTMRGRYDAGRQPGTDLSWTRCPVGLRWNGKGCDGEARPMTWAEAASACPEGYRFPSRAELLGLLARCPDAPGGGARCGCRASGGCAGLFGADEGAYWAADGEGGRAWVVSLGDGAQALATTSTAGPARCVKTGPP